jgi:hypothetical protein
MRNRFCVATGANDMSKGRYLGLTVLFLLIAVFVSGSLVRTLHSAYGASGQSLNETIQELQRA